MREGNAGTKKCILYHNFSVSKYNETLYSITLFEAAPLTKPGASGRPVCRTLNQYSARVYR